MMPRVRPLVFEEASLPAIGAKRLMFVSPENMNSVFQVFPVSAHQRISFHEMEGGRFLSSWLCVRCVTSEEGLHTLEWFSIVESPAEAIRLIENAEDDIFVYAQTDAMDFLQWSGCKKPIQYVAPAIEAIDRASNVTFFEALYYGCLSVDVPQQPGSSVPALTTQLFAYWANEMITCIFSVVYERARMASVV